MRAKFTPPSTMGKNGNMSKVPDAHFDALFFGDYVDDVVFKQFQALKTSLKHLKIRKKRVVFKSGNNKQYPENCVIMRFSGLLF